MYLVNVGSLMGIYENDFVIDLSATKNTAQLATELSSLLESSETKGKKISLNLGDLDLKQSQLLSIKALIESIDSTVSSISTKSEMTEASAVSLGIAINSNKAIDVELPFQDSISEHIDDLNETFTPTENTELENNDEDNKNNSESLNIVTEIPEKTELDESKILTNPEVQAALDRVLGVQQETQKEEFVKTNIELVEPKNPDNDFEVTETKERSSEGKYVLLDTEGIMDDYEENTENTAELPTLYLTQTLRSGQTVTYEGNIFIVGDTHPGSEVIAKGDITVWGILGGIAHAGSDGNVNAKVRALKLNPIQLRIAGLYSRRNDTVNVPYIQRTNEFTPEEARINNKQIVVYKTLRRED